LQGYVIDGEADKAIATLIVAGGDDLQAVLGEVTVVVAAGVAN
jgi:hypothetical protein